MRSACERPHPPFGLVELPELWPVAVYELLDASRVRWREGAVRPPRWLGYAVVIVAVAVLWVVFWLFFVFRGG